ncbi:MAG: hypothetical protein V4714_03965 [Bacteroidota bacterium]
MSSDLRLLIQIIGIPFYQRNAGFFLVAFLLLFGVVSPQLAISYHLAILHAMVESALILLAAAVVWLLYALKCAHHALKTLALPENEFTYCISLLPLRRQLFSLFCTQSFIFLPIWLYALTAVGVACSRQAYGSAAVIVVYNSLLCLLMAGLFYRKIKHPNQDHTTNFLSQYLDQKFTKPYPAFFWSYLLNEEKVLLLSTKAFSILILVGIMPLYTSVDYDQRMLRIGFLLSAFTHTILVNQFRQFEETRLLLSRNLPYSLLQRFGRYAVIYIGVLLPELVVLTYSFSATFGWGQWLDYVALSLSLCLVCHCFLFINHMPSEKYINRVFYAFVVLFLLVMYRISPLILAAGLSGLAFYLLQKNYYRYEWTAPEEGS